jgi:hypothetical protein
MMKRPRKRRRKLGLLISTSEYRVEHRWRGLLVKAILGLTSCLETNGGSYM